MTTATDHNPQADYHRGQMEVAGQRSTYMLFNTLIHRCSTFIAALVAFLVLWLCGHVAFLGSAVVGVLIVAAGLWFNRGAGHNSGY